ncbi:C-type lectin lectoxin-Lio3-like [Haliotis rubra]|uniref:C-type lectin lectoxin-Lio3-like n=1 Tax=Haliotis rubra TaxID=36100 RepID=UPI001EE5822C|nr:C-type lectin lectoxin-Lio3-like [Haliotis rubra]
MGLTMVVVLQGMYLASLPPGVPVSSRVDCVSRCYHQGNCSSVFYDGSTKKCQLSAEVFLERDLTSTHTNMQYLEWKEDDCDKGYTWYRSLGLCYKIYTSTKSWFQANHTCNQDGGYLIKVDSLGINAFMNKISDSYSAFVWVNGLEDSVTGKWTWSDGTLINTTYWDVTQPDSGPVQQCILVRAGADNVNGWHDYFCHYDNAVPMFVCQVNLKEVIQIGMC